MSRPRFQQIYLEITNVCNLNCPFCSQDVREQKFLSIDEIEAIIKKIKPFTHSVYLHVKGEPLVHPMFREIIDLITSYDLNIKITTNGINLLKYRDILLGNNKISKINISLQSLVNLDESNRVNYLNNVKSFITQNKSKHIYLRNWGTDSKTSLYIKDFIRKLYPKSQLEKDEDLSKFVHYSKHYLFEWPSLDRAIVEERTTCLGGTKQLAILSNGTICLCCLDTNGDTAIGNIFEDNFEDILRSEIYLKATKNMPYFPLCERCSYRLKFRKGGHHES